MAYNKYTWKNGDIIDETRLNNIENGIAALDTENGNSLKLTSQNLTENQKQQVRQNISIPSSADFNTLNNTVTQIQTTANNAVLYSANQNLTDAQKQTARNNIGASHITHLIDGSADHSLRGTNTKANGNGYEIGSSAFAIGENTRASGNGSVAEGQQSIASGVTAHAEGAYTEASNTASHAEGRETIASGQTAHAEGYKSHATESYSHAEGKEAQAIAVISHAQGEGTIANHRAQTALGAFNIEDPAQVGNPNSTDPKDREAAQRGTYIEIVGNGADNDHRSNARTLDWDGNEVLAGKLTIGANAEYPNEVPTLSQVEGLVSTASQVKNLIDGTATESLRSISADSLIGTYATALGPNTKASGSASFATGAGSQATGSAAHAEGNSTIASAESSHAEGISSTAGASASHAEGMNNIASGISSHAEGINNVAVSDGSHAGGKYGLAGNFAEVIGNGTDTNHRSNARTLDWNGNEVLAGKLTIGANAQSPNDVPTLAQVQGMILPIPASPTVDGTYVLKVVVANGEATYQWVLE